MLIVFWALSTLIFSILYYLTLLCFSLYKNFILFDIDTLNVLTVSYFLSFKGKPYFFPIFVSLPRLITSCLTAGTAGRHSVSIVWINQWITVQSCFSYTGSANINIISSLFGILGGPKYVDGHLNIPYLEYKILKLGNKMFSAFTFPL